MMFHILFVTTLFALAVGEKIPNHKVCCSTLGHAESAKIQGARVKDGKYIFTEELNIEVHFAFEMYQDVKKAILVARVLWQSFDRVLSIENPDLCQGSTCPLRENKEYALKRWMEIPKLLFPVEITLEVQVIDKQSNATIACFEFPAKYVDE